MKRAVDFMPSSRLRRLNLYNCPSDSAQTIAPTAAVVLGSVSRPLTERNGYQSPTR